MDFCVRTLYDQICDYAHFINEAPGVSAWSRETSGDADVIA